MTRIKTTLLLLAAALFVLSCGGKSGIEGDGEEDGEEGVEVIEDGVDTDAADQPVDWDEEDGEVVCECTEDSECDDGLYCNGEETCDGCLCHAGDPVDCSDGVDCTIDECLEATQECQNIPDHERCGPDEMCDPDEGCIPANTCSTDVECQDDFFCNGEEICDPDTGRCASGTPPDCSDDFSCTEDICVESEESCVNNPDDMLCTDDGLFCTEERCDPLNPGAGEDGCVTEDRICEDDGYECTQDICNEETDACESVADHGFCSDDLMCNGEEICDPSAPGADSRGCAGGEEVICDDSVDCTIDSCVEGTGCQFVPDNSLCDEGEICDLEDGCVPFTCTSNEECDDGFYCNGSETCNITEGTCEAGTPPDCGDDVDCTDDVCVEIPDGYECQHTPDNLLCADDLYCTVNERCDITAGCLSDPRDCGDGIDCTIDTCSESESACISTPDDSLCTDDLYCTVNERCDITAGCLSDPRDCGDSVSCTEDSCNEAAGRCDNIPNDDLCRDSIFCDGEEWCDPTSGCQAGTFPCDDDLDCTDNLCSETSDPHCSYPILAGFCLIDGTCYDDGEGHPDIPCLVCDAGRDQTGWSVRIGFCFIEGVCYRSGETNSGNECQVCDPDSSQTAWTDLNSDPSSGIFFPCARGYGLCFSGVCCMIRRPECSDGRDNNGNDLADWPDEPGCTDPLDNDEDGIVAIPFECSDGLDNDGDTLIDMIDPGCHTSQDNYEAEAHPACNDGVDNDGDGLADFPDDPGCESLIDGDESDDTICAQCNETLDNDGDGNVDFPDDEGCSSASDNDEWDPGITPACSDGVDNDDDTLIDYPDDPGCFSRTDRSESNAFLPRCSDGIDNDCDGFTDMMDPDCWGWWDDTERSFFMPPIPRCGDMCDNDGDTLIDFPADPGCASPTDDEERAHTSECMDGLDNDGDTLIDSADPGCTSSSDNYEGDLLPQCNDGFDNDWDGLIDFGADLQCFNPSDPSENI